MIKSYSQKDVNLPIKKSYAYDYTQVIDKENVVKNQERKDIEENDRKKINYYKNCKVKGIGNKI